MGGLILLGVIAFSLGVIFQVVNLPVEFDASRRARNALLMTGLVRPEEDREVGKVLNAAAMTYVAGTITAIVTLLYYLIRLGVLGGSSNDE
jgi:Zn-dependent membrane protease YugP